MSKSKETIANEILGKRPVNVDIEWDEVLECMSVYGKEIAIGFTGWIEENNFGTKKSLKFGALIPLLTVYIPPNNFLKNTYKH